MLKYLLDENESSRLEVALAASGRDVVSITGLKMMRTKDPKVLEFAHQEGRVVITQNAKDFKELHEASTDHSGIMVHYNQNGAALTSEVLTFAVKRAEEFYPDMSGQFVSLNNFQW